MEQVLKEILNEIKGLKTEVAGVKADVSDLRDGQASIIQRLEDLGGQQTENNRYIQALLHRTDELDAKFDGLLHTTATKDSIANLATKEDVSKLEAKIDVLNVRLFNQETDIQLLKKVK